MPCHPFVNTHFPKASSTSPRLGSWPLTRPLQVKGMSSSAGYACSCKENLSESLRKTRESTHHLENTTFHRFFFFLSKIKVNQEFYYPYSVWNLKRKKKLFSYKYNTCLEKKYRKIFLWKSDNPFPLHLISLPRDNYCYNWHLSLQIYPHTLKYMHIYHWKISFTNRYSCHMHTLS